MADFTLIANQFNTGSDSVPIWTATAQATGGTGGANEIRFCGSSAGSAVTAANWPNFVQPASVQAVPEAWCINTDNGTTATGYKIATYGAPSSGIVPYSLVARIGWSADGTFAGRPVLTAYTNSSHVNPSAGTQPPGANNDTFTNGSSGDTSNTSYLKINAYGYGVDGSGTQQTPGAGSLTTTVAATDGTNGHAVTSSNAWLPTHWQSAQGSIQDIQLGTTPNWTTHTGTTVAYYLYYAFVLFAGPGLTPNSAITFGLNFSYSFT